MFESLIYGFVQWPGFLFGNGSRAAAPELSGASGGATGGHYCNTDLTPLLSRSDRASAPVISLGVVFVIDMIRTHTRTPTHTYT